MVQHISSIFLSTTTEVWVEQYWRRCHQLKEGEHYYNFHLEILITSVWILDICIRLTGNNILIEGTKSSFWLILSSGINKKLNSSIIMCPFIACVKSLTATQRDFFLHSSTGCLTSINTTSWLFLKTMFTPSKGLNHWRGIPLQKTELSTWEMELMELSLVKCALLMQPWRYSMPFQNKIIFGFPKYGVIEWSTKHMTWKEMWSTSLPKWRARIKWLKR